MLPRRRSARLRTDSEESSPPSFSSITHLYAPSPFMPFPPLFPPFSLFCPVL
jgi:hypothetical protein